MNLLKNNRNFPIVTAFYALHLTGFQMEPHSHKSLEIMYVTKGQCHIFVEENKLSLYQQQFILVDSKVAHSLSVLQEQPCSILNLEFYCSDKGDAPGLLELAENCPAFVSLCRDQRPFLVGTDSANLGYALKDLITQLKAAQKKNFSYLHRLLFLRMMFELSQCIYESKRMSALSGLSYLKKACGFIEENLLEDLKVPEIAARAGINKSYLQSLFQKHLHTTVTDYINKRRLEQAAFFLTNSAMSITEVGYASGYNSRQHFGYTFEQFYGCSPKTYRQLHRTALSPSTGHDQYILGEDGAVEKTPL